MFLVGRINKNCRNQRTHGVDGKVLLNISQDFDKSIFTEDLRFS